MVDCIIVGSGVAGISAALTLQANRKSFMIFRFDDNHIQLMSFPVRKYIGIGWLKAYYDITDKSTTEKLLKLFDAHREPDE